MARSFLIAGGTGRQGGAVVDALLTDPTSPVDPKHVYVITRNAAGEAATRLAARGIQTVTGDLGQPQAIFQQLQDRDVELATTSVFLAQAHGPTELEDARKLIDVAHANGVSHFVYSSVDRGGPVQSDRDPSYCKTFSDKFHIEQHLREIASKTRSLEGNASKMDYTILRPVWFADNAIWGFPGRLCMTGWRDWMSGKRMQVVVLKDHGRWAAEALLRADRAGLRNQAITIASDELTFAEVDKIFREETGGPVGVTYALPARLMIWSVKDLRTMFSWINERDYGADIAQLSKTLEPTTFRTWVKEMNSSANTEQNH